MKFFFNFTYDMASGKTIFLALFAVLAVSNAEVYDNGCPRDWGVNIHLPHPTECELFYQCVHGNKVLMNCPPGLVFNIELQVCDWPWNVDCARPCLNPTTTSPEIEETTHVEEDETYESTTLKERELTTEPVPTTETTTIKEAEPTTTEYIPTTTVQDTTTTETTTKYVPTTTTVKETVPTTTVKDTTTTTTETTTQYVPSTTTVKQTVPTTTIKEESTTEFVPTTTTVKVTETTIKEIEETTTDYITTVKEDSETTTNKEIEETTTEYFKTTTEEDSEICPPGFFGNVPHPIYCDVFFFCSGGIAIKQRCPEGQEFDPDTARCVPITGGGCTSTTTSIPTTETTTKSTTQNDVDEPTDVTESYKSTTIQQDQDEITTVSSSPETTPVSEIVTEDPICPPGFFGNVPHPVYCYKFFFCSGGIAIKQRCPEGQEFDRFAEGCVPITGVGCTETTTVIPTTTARPDGKDSVEDPDIDDNDSEDVNENEKPEINQPTEPVPKPICPPGFFGNVAHPEYCDAFFFCSGGMAIKQWCPEGQEFDALVERCIAITGSGCTDPITPETTTENIIGSDEQNDIDEEVDEVICQPGFFGNVPHPQYCDKFFFCSGGMAIKQRCPVGQVFDKSVSRCAATIDNTCTQAQSTKCPQDFFGYLPHSQLPEVFLYCSEGGAVELHCSDGYKFNFDQNICTKRPTSKIRKLRSVEPPRVKTPGYIPNCPPDWFGQLPHPYICESYFLCSGGIAIQLWCANGFEYDPVIDKCVPITGDGCTQTTTVDSTTSTTKTPSSSSNTSPTVTTRKLPTHPLCPPDFFGHIPHPTICDSYYLCSMGVKIQLWCADGFEFDPINAKCSRISEDGCFANQN